MADPSPQTTLLQGCLDRLRQGDRSARDDLLRHACGRLERLTRKMLRDYPGVQRWAQTDDVLQNALLRLLRALEEVQPASVRDFFGLSAVLIRRELIDLARRFRGPEGIGANHATCADANGSQQPPFERQDQSHDPSVLAAWCEFHERVGELPQDECEVVHLLYYQELSQAEAAAVLNVTVRTVQRRWQAALLKLHAIFNGQWPES
jgi:RNA polymerase sigma-70 factor (ECF subfamily)